MKKKDPTFRIILDLSSPHGESVNDGIDKLEYSVQYQSFDDAVDLVRMPSVRSQDFPLLRMHWVPLVADPSHFIFTPSQTPWPGI